MSVFIVIPKYQSKDNPNVQYNAPIMYVEAQSGEEALKKTRLSELPEWSIHLSTVFQRKNPRPVAPKREFNLYSKSQKGKIITGNSLSRPQRRAANRLKTKTGNPSGSHHKGGSMQCW